MNQTQFRRNMTKEAKAQIQSFAFRLWADQEVYPSWVACMKHGLTCSAEYFHQAITPAWKLAHGINLEVLELSDEQVLEFAFKVWTRGIYPSYPSCRKEGLVCSNERFRKLVNKAWKEENGVILTAKTKAKTQAKDHIKIDYTKPAMKGLKPANESEKPAQPLKPPLDPPRDPKELAVWEQRRAIERYRSEFHQRRKALKGWAII